MFSLVMRSLSFLLLLFLIACQAYAGPFLYTKSEFKGDEDGRKNDVNSVRLGYSLSLANLSPYAHFGVGINSPKGNDVFDGDEFRIAVIGVNAKPLQSFSVKTKFEKVFYHNDENDWKFEVKTQYNFSG